MTTAGWIVSILWSLFILALLAAAIAWLISELSGRGNSGMTSGFSAREILDRRLASGELSLEQYSELREHITNGATSVSHERTPPAPTAPG